MKIIKYLTMLSAAAVIATSCEVEPADLFSTDPVAPVMNELGEILMTEYSADEEVTFSWSAARNVEGKIGYVLCASYADETASFDVPFSPNVEGTYYTTKKSAFADFLAGQIAGFPEHENFKMSFYVNVYVDGVQNRDLTSAPTDATVFVNANNVASVLKAPSTVVFEVEHLDETLELLSWTAPIIGINEKVTSYLIEQRIAGADWAEYSYPSAEATSVSMSVDSWNNYFTSIGWTEGVAQDIEFRIGAATESTGGEYLWSNTVKVNVTTYLAVYPEALYVVGSHNGWDAGNPSASIKQSSNADGWYDAFIDLTTGDANVEFKLLQEVGSWDVAYTSLDIEKGDNSENDVYTGNVTDAPGTGNIVLPSGFYRMGLDMKRKTVLFVKVESVGLVGDATPAGWDQKSAIDMVYDAASHTYSQVVELTPGAFKIVLNKSWSYAVGYGGTFEGGDISVSAAGTYNVVLDLNSYPYGVSVKNSAIPDKVMLVGDFNGLGWGDTAAQSPYLTMRGDGGEENVFYGVVSYYNPTWGAKLLYELSSVQTWVGGIMQSDAPYYVFATGDYDNLTIANGNYCVCYDRNADTFTAVPVQKISLIGAITGDSSWGTDLHFTYNEAAGVYEIKDAQLSAGEYKIRFNDDWSDFPASFELCGNPDELTYKGSNLNFTDSGTFDVVLDFTGSANHTISFIKK